MMFQSACLKKIMLLPQHYLRMGLFLLFLIASPSLYSWANQPLPPQQLPHLPPSVQPNGLLALPNNHSPTTDDDTTLEAIELVDTPSLIAKQAAKAGLSKPPTLVTETSPTATTLSVKDLQLTAFNALKPTEKLTALEQQVQETDLHYLWNAVVEHNPVVRFSLEKIALPMENHDAHSSQFLRKSLNVLISGAALGSTLLVPGGGYQSAGILAGSQAVQNLVNGKTKPVSTLTATEHIQLANLVDDLKRQLVENYQTYQQTLRTVQQAQSATQRAYQHYETAAKNQNPVEILTTLQIYHQALKREQSLKQQTKLARLKLERLSGQPAVAQLVLVAQPKLALQKAKEPAVTTAIALPSLQLLAPQQQEEATAQQQMPSKQEQSVVGAAASPLNKQPLKTTVQQGVSSAIKQVKQLKLPFKEDTLF